ncbi:response regulator [candidate division CSSED10-310 bacterium]|uniref:histidine kinase n=1 Tax=candidate division CSSED10-310 bacterium TaxID=2855610 RepID=A0ABV6YZF8_UNCC1
MMKRILVVDNDKLILEFMRDILSEQGYEVITVANGLSALDVLRKNKLDVIFVDLVMSNIDGKKLCKVIRGMDKFKETLLIILTATATEDKEVNISDLGANFCVAKGPFKEMRQNILDLCRKYENGVLPDSSEKMIGIQSYHRRRITEELLVVKKHFETILQRLIEGVLEVTPTGRIIYANSTAVKLIGKAEEELLGLDFVRLFAAADRQHVREFLEAREPSRKDITADSPLHLNNHLVLLDILPIESDSMIVILNDVSKYKQAEAQLYHEKERFRLLVEKSPLGISLIGKDGLFKYINPQFTEIFGYTLEDIDIQPEFAQLCLAQSPEEGKTAILTCTDGSQKTINYKQMKMDSGEQIVVFEDITEKILLEEQIQHAQKMESLGVIASGVAHNFRNILTGILSTSEVMQFKYKEDPYLQEKLQRINTFVERGTDLIRGLMLFSRKEPQKEHTTINLSNILKETYTIISEYFDKMVQVRIKIPTSLYVEADYARLSQVFLNLCNNARDAMPAGGQLTIEAREEAGQGVIIISDTGSGMTAGIRKKCFDPFFTTKDTGLGTGLGLSTAYGIIKNYGGNIECFSEPDKGTTFTIFLPLAPAQKPEQMKFQNSTEVGKGEKILVVDDEKEILLALEELLIQLGYTVKTVRDGQTALDLFSTWQPACVLLDRSMPVMDGLSCARKIIELDPEARIVIISGYDAEEQENLDEDIRPFIKGYLTKPIKATTLGSLLQILLK